MKVWEKEWVKLFSWKATEHQRHIVHHPKNIERILWGSSRPLHLPNNLKSSRIIQNEAFKLKESLKNPWRIALDFNDGHLVIASAQYHHRKHKASSISSSASSLSVYSPNSHLHCGSNEYISTAKPGLVFRSVFGSIIHQTSAANTCFIQFRQSLISLDISVTSYHAIAQTNVWFNL